MSTPDPFSPFGSPTAPPSYTSDTSVSRKPVVPPPPQINAGPLVNELTRSVGQENKRESADQAEFDRQLKEARSAMASLPSDEDIANKENSLLINLSKVGRPPAPDVLYKTKNFKLMLGISAAFAALGAIATRGNIATAINAFAGGLQGYVAGDRAKYAADFQKWKAENDQAMKDTELRLQDYQDTLNNDRYNVAQKLQLLQITARNVQDDHMLRAATSQDIRAVGALIETQSKALENYRKHVGVFNGAVKPPTAEEDKSAAQAVSSVLSTSGIPSFKIDLKLAEGGVDPKNPNQKLPQVDPQVQAEIWAEKHPDVVQLNNYLRSQTIVYMRQGMTASDAAMAAYLEAKKNGVIQNIRSGHYVPPVSDQTTPPPGAVTANPTPGSAEPAGNQG